MAVGEKMHYKCPRVIQYSYPSIQIRDNMVEEDVISTFKLIFCRAFSRVKSEESITVRNFVNQMSMLTLVCQTLSLIYLIICVLTVKHHRHQGDNVSHLSYFM